MLNLKHLYYFHIFAKELSTTKAATKLQISAPALSNQLKELDDFLGFKLTQRVRGKFCVTDPGKMILRYTDRIFPPYEELSAKISSTPHRKYEHVRFGISQYLEAGFSLDYLVSLAKLNLSDIEKTSLTFDSSDKLLVDFVEGKFNLIIGAFFSTLRDEKNWDCQELIFPVQLMVPLRLIENLDKPTMDGMLLDLNSLFLCAEKLKISMALPSRPSVLRDETDQFLSSINATPVRIIECNSASGMHQLIERQLAMGFMSTPANLNTNQSKATVILGPGEGYWKHTVSIISHKVIPEFSDLKR